MSQLSGKRIAIDISIYLYKFSADDSLLENMYLMLSIFRYYGIIPIFIFDGKPPNEKKDLLEKRKEEKNKAKQQYMELKKQILDDPSMEKDELQELSDTMDSLKKKFITIQKEQINQVKQLITSFGASYSDAPEEADQLCALLVAKKKVWACMSEDMDLFVYGCPRVLRYFSLIKHNAVIYNTKQIFDDLGITENEFRQICVLSGTDYNIHSNKNTDLYKTLKWFKRYHQVKNKKHSNMTNFYEWLQENTSYIEDYLLIQHIHSLFDLESKKEEYNSLLEDIRISTGSYDKEGIKNLLINEGFLF